MDALAAFARDASPEHLVAAIDSGLHTGVLRPDDVPLLREKLPARLRAALGNVDGRAESGTESLARMRLARLGCSIEPQVEIGPYRVDLLLDGWLALEVDSEEWHGTQRVEDARKATWLTGQGYRVEHADYQQVLFEWESVEHSLRGILSRRRPGQPRPAPRSAPR